MRFMAGRHQGVAAVFAVAGERAVDLTALDPAFGADLTGVISMTDGVARARALVQGAPTVAVAAITPALPIARPGKVICLGLNYADHAKEGGHQVPSYPALFMRGPNSLIAADAPLIRPACSEQLDYEAELLVVIGCGGRHIAEAAALDHVFGYTLFNDGSVRDYQRKGPQWTPGKNFDATGAVGPVVVTPDELPAGAAGLGIESRVGAETLQRGSTADMLWPVAATIATISEYATLEPGDLIATGTPPGVGHARKPPRWLRPGETVEVEIEGIGVLRNPVVAETEPAAGRP